MIEARRIMDFIMGGCAGFCFFYGQFIGYSIGTLMVISFIVYAYRTRMLAQIDKDVQADLQEEKKEEIKHE
jgi:hypothetical protein